MNQTMMSKSENSGTVQLAEATQEEETPLRNDPPGGDVTDTQSPTCDGKCLPVIVRCCAPILLQNHPLPPERLTRCHQFKHSLMCPPFGFVGRTLTCLVLVMLFWAVAWAFTENVGLKGIALPGGDVFELLILTVICVLLGWISGLLTLPPLFGMLIAGILVGNLPTGRSIDCENSDEGMQINDSLSADFASNACASYLVDIHPLWSIALRNIALVTILTRAGLGLDSSVLKAKPFVVMRLAFMPCIAEAATSGIFAHLLLKIPWEWGFMLGFVLAAVSPAVVVPQLLRLQQQRYGVDKGIPTIVIAAASMDDVLAISAFGVILGITFSKGSLEMNILRGPMEVLMGVSYGAVVGYLQWFVPAEDLKGVGGLRVAVLMCSSLFVSFSSRLAEFSGAGALACLTQALVAQYGWSKQSSWGKQQNKQDPVTKAVGKLWLLFEPILFGLIGTEIKFSNLEAILGDEVADTFLMAFLVMLFGLSVRVLVSALAVLGAGLNFKELMFVPIAWLPKATVQAAIGSWALDTARERNAGKQMEIYGIKILTAAVLVILITAPIGSYLITILGPKLLTRSPPLPQEMQTFSESKPVACSTA